MASVFFFYLFYGLFLIFPSLCGGGCYCDDQGSHTFLVEFAHSYYGPEIVYFMLVLNIPLRRFTGLHLAG